MSIVVGHSPHHDDLGALDLACQLARSDQAPVHAVTVVPRGWPTAVAGDTDREYRRWAEEQGAAAAAGATAYLAEHGDVEADASWVSGRSVPPALLEQARARSASLLVVGSGQEVSHGQIGLTSKTDRLLHSSGVPVAVAPRGYQAGPGSTVRRITLAFRGDDATRTLLKQVAEIARRADASLRLATLAVRGRTMHPQLVSGAEEMVLDAWLETAHAEQAEAREHLHRLGFTDDDLTSAVPVGRSWGGALDALGWERGDILVVGSSSTHRLDRVFLGSSASKIVRHSTVPVVVVP